jgi:hypothetical protein
MHDFAGFHHVLEGLEIAGDDFLTRLAEQLGD